LQDYLRILDASIADIKSKQDADTITYQIPSTQITWADPVTSNAITVQNVLQDLYGHINNIFNSPSFSTGPISTSNVEVPRLPPNQAMSMGLDNYLTDIHSKIDNLSSLQLKHVANSTIENLSTCIEGFKRNSTITLTTTGETAEISAFLNYLDSCMLAWWFITSLSSFNVIFYFFLLLLTTTLSYVINKVFYLFYLKGYEFIKKVYLFI
jgi:hypothetical protein